MSAVSALGTRKSNALTPDAIYGSGPGHAEKIRARRIADGLQADYVSSNFTQRLDHFNNTNTDTFPMRLLIDETHYVESSAPILFYAGNEGDVTNFYDNSGFMTTTLAKKWGALVVFAEHRYYGTSMPFDNKTKAFEKENLKYLNVQQVLEDFVAVIQDVKTNRYPMLKDRAVIAFGGSYGGMLAAWIRMKYPQHIQGALASSAPVLWFEGKINPNAYTQVASKVIKDMGGKQCYDLYHEGFTFLTNMKGDSQRYQKLKEIFNLCTVPTKASEIQALIETLSDSIGTMAMVNYPYPTNFINSLPAWPQQYACTQAKMIDSSAENFDSFNFTSIEALQRGANVFYNYTGEKECLDVTADQSEGLDDSGWTIQTCIDMPMPMGDDPAQSCFSWENWWKQGHTDFCKKEYNLTPQYDFALDFFGGRDVNLDWSHYSNIIFSNGDLDPWHAGGVTEDVMPNNPIIWIEKSGHHLDLRLPNVLDPPAVTAARAQEEKWLKTWIEDYQGDMN